MNFTFTPEKKRFFFPKYQIFRHLGQKCGNIKKSARNKPKFFRICQNKSKQWNPTFSICKHNSITSLICNALITNTQSTSRSWHYKITLPRIENSSEERLGRSSAPQRREKIAQLACQIKKKDGTQWTKT